MPNRIQLLGDDLINKIAAGEVVERPASVVKELLENALDASASRIRADVRAGGKQEVRVADDGTGMSRDDAILSLERHATSKIASPDDLQSIVTLGFRGEALPSIAAVSRLTLETRQSDDLAGTKITVDGGAIRNVTDVGRDAGTTVSVRNLFFNLPARRKFLRSADTEFRHIVQHLTQIAIGHPNVAFKLLHNEREVLVLERSEGRSGRVRDVLGSGLSEGLLQVRWEGEGLRVEGLVGPPDTARSSRIHQLVFVNRRCVSSKLVSHAVLAAYGPSLSRDRYPIFVLFLDVDPERVDVNVHPTKREVRFSDDKTIHDVVSRAIQQALRSSGAVGQVAFSRPAPSKLRSAFEAMASTLPASQAATDEQAKAPAQASDKQLRLSLLRQPSPSEQPSGAMSGDASSAIGLSRETEEERPVFWQLHDRYVLAPVQDGLLVIDQHAAHERIIYEETLGHFGEQKAPAQQLLFPLTLEFSPTEMQILREILPLLEQMGFGIREFGRAEVMVEAVPSDLRDWGGGEVLRALVDDMARMGQIRSGLGEKVAASYACHSAIKAGEKLSLVEMQNLVDRLFAAKQPLVCPHGRPVVAKMPLEGIDRAFGR